MASRRSADRLIASGAVRVNGKVPPPAGLLIDPERDRVTVEGQDVEPPAAHSYIAINKPAGVIVSASDERGRTTVFDLVGSEAGPGRLFAVGRLDMDTHGLLLLTDDGELANRLAHPSYKVAKEYLATVTGLPGERDLRTLATGVRLEDGRTQPAEVELVGTARGLAQVRLVLREGRNRQVRRMLEAVGHPVKELTRTSFGPIRLGRLKPGSWRRLRPPEIAALKQAAKL